MFKIEKISIIETDVDCIVNPCRYNLTAGGGCCGIIHDAAGPELYEECKTIGHCDRGSAVITKGYNLKQPYVIHTHGPFYTGSLEEPQLLYNCYKNSLNVASAHKIKSIAFPFVSTGHYGYPASEAILIALYAVKDSDLDITFCFTDDYYQSYIDLALADLEIYKNMSFEDMIKDLRTDMSTYKKQRGKQRSLIRLFWLKFKNKFL